MAGAVTRFAPSPTGRLHVGNMRTALINWLFARKAGGRFILRLDDTDAERSTEAFAQGIREDMAWLALSWDAEERQSARFSRYEAARADLVAAGRLYPCYETPEELDTQRGLMRARGRAPVYDRAGLKLSAQQRAELEAQGRAPHWRFRLSDEAVAFEDLIRGPVRFEAGHVSDPVLIRADGVPTYTLASVVDDMDFGVSHVIRGEDHVANTAVQVELIAALGGADIAFAHHPFLVAADGEGLSKRKGSAAIAELREAGVEAMALVSWLARIGTSDAIEPAYAMADLIESFDLAKISRNPPHYEPGDVAALSRRWLHGAPWESVAESLDVLGLARAGEAFWIAVRGNLERLEDVCDWWAVCTAPLQPRIEDADFAATAADLLPPEPWDAETWKTWTAAVREATGTRGKALFLPLRLALTGREHGPELAALLPFIGRARVLARLAGEKA
jgi:glutamyl-tRNA synthetase